MCRNEQYTSRSRRRASLQAIITPIAQLIGRPRSSPPESCRIFHIRMRYEVELFRNEPSMIPSFLQIDYEPGLGFI